MLARRCDPAPKIGLFAGVKRAAITKVETPIPVNYLRPGALPRISERYSVPSRLARQIPNTLTSFRIVIALLFPTLHSERRLAALAAALTTEYFDGAISRWFGFQTRLGQLLDPIADKLLFATVAITFLREKRVSPGEVALLGLRDFTVVAGSLPFLIKRQWADFLEMKPQVFGKLTTAMQYAAFFSLLFAHRSRRPLTKMTGALGAVAAAQYYFAMARPIFTIAEQTS